MKCKKHCWMRFPGLLKRETSFFLLLCLEYGLDGWSSSSYLGPQVNFEGGHHMPRMATQKEPASLVTVGLPYQLCAPYLWTSFMWEGKKTLNAIPKFMGKSWEFRAVTQANSLSWPILTGGYHNYPYLPCCTNLPAAPIPRGDIHRIDLIFIKEPEIQIMLSLQIF